MEELIRQLESIKQDLIQGKIKQQIDHRLSRTIEDKIDKAINYTHCCESDREQLCECDAPLIRTSDKGGEYCGSCEKDLD